MSHLTRTAKSGNDWTLNDLEAYHIKLEQIAVPEFFGVERLLETDVHPELVNHTDADAMEHDSYAELITLLDLAMHPSSGGSGVIDFTVELLKVLGYVHRQRVARTRINLPLFICGEMRETRIDVCLFDREDNDIFLLVQEEKPTDGIEQRNNVHSRAQLVAAAIAAFNENNSQRDLVGLPPLEVRVMYGITMNGTSPTFFRIPVTQYLSTHIRRGEYPEVEMRVTYCYPPVPRPARRHEEGMKPLDNRLEILRCFETFKMVASI